MAVTKIWAIKDSLQRVLDYAANPDKTEYDALAQTLHYAENDAKTKLNESAQLVTGIHCRANHAWEDMRAVQERFGKIDGVVALHAYQSFREGEVTPEQCHKIGRGTGPQGLGQAISGAGRHTHEHGQSAQPLRYQFRIVCGRQEIRAAPQSVCRVPGGI